MNTESKFSMVLSKEEQVLFCEGAYKPAFIFKKLVISLLLFIFLGGFFSFFFMGFSAAINADFVDNPFTWFFTLENNIFKFYILGILVLFLLSNISNIVASGNTYLCITNKRFIIRGGAFSTTFVDYELKDIFSVEVISGMFDLKGEQASGNLVITLRQYESTSEGKLTNKGTSVMSIKRAYDAYRILDEANNK